MVSRFANAPKQGEKSKRHFGAFNSATKKHNKDEFNDVIKTKN